MDKTFEFDYSAFTNEYIMRKKRLLRRIIWRLIQKHKTLGSPVEVLELEISKVEKTFRDAGELRKRAELRAQGLGLQRVNEYILRPTARTMRPLTRARAYRRARAAAAHTTPASCNDGSGQGDPDSSDPPKQLHSVVFPARENHSFPLPWPRRGCFGVASERGRTA
jgi:hypothetical protein